MSKLEDMRVHFENIYNSLMDGEVVPNKYYIDRYVEQENPEKRLTPGFMGLATKQLNYLLLYNDSMRMPSSTWNTRRMRERIKNMSGN